MYTLKQKNAASINNPDEGEKTLFLDIADNKIKTKDENGDIEEITIIDPDAPKVYKALLTQTGTSAPVAIVLENTLGGEVVWSYDNIGSYIGTLSGAFPENKCSIGNGEDNSYVTVYFNVTEAASLNLSRLSSNTILLSQDSEGIPLNNFTGVPISIEVYP